MNKASALIFVLSAIWCGYAGWAFWKDSARRYPWLVLCGGYLCIARNYWYYLHENVGVSDLLVAIFMFSATGMLFEQMRKLCKRERKQIESPTMGDGQD